MTISEQIALLRADHTDLLHALGACVNVLREYRWLPIVGEWGNYTRAEQTTGALRCAVGEAFAEIKQIATQALQAAGDRAAGACQPIDDPPYVPLQRTAQELAEIQERCIAP